MTIVVVVWIELNPTLAPTNPVMIVVVTTLLGGTNLLGGNPPLEDVATMYLTVMIQLLGGNHLIGGSEVTDLLLPAMILETTTVKGIVIHQIVQTENVIDLLKPPV